MNTEKRNSGAWFWIIFLVIFIVGTVCAFVLVPSYTAKFWFSYFACLIALFGLIFGFWQTSRSINRASTFLFTTVSVLYAVCTAIATVLCNIFPVSAAWLGVIELIILALYIVLMIVSYAAYQNISSQTSKEKHQVHNARADTERVQQLIDQTNKLPEENRELARKALIDVQEKLRYSDPIPGKGTERQARDMDTAIGELETTMNFLVHGQADINLLEEKARLAINSIDVYNRAKMANK